MRTVQPVLVLLLGLVLLAPSTGAAAAYYEESETCSVPHTLPVGAALDGCSARLRLQLGDVECGESSCTFRVNASLEARGTPPGAWDASIAVADDEVCARSGTAGAPRCASGAFVTLAVPGECRLFTIEGVATVNAVAGAVVQMEFQVCRATGIAPA